MKRIINLLLCVFMLVSFPSLAKGNADFSVEPKVEEVFFSGWDNTFAPTWNTLESDIFSVEEGKVWLLGDDTSQKLIPELALCSLFEIDLKNKKPTGRVITLKLNSRSIFSIFTLQNENLLYLGGLFVDLTDDSLHEMLYCINLLEGKIKWLKQDVVVTNMYKVGNDVFVSYVDLSSNPHSDPYKSSGKFISYFMIYDSEGNRKISYSKSDVLLTILGYDTSKGITYLLEARGWKFVSPRETDVRSYCRVAMSDSPVSYFVDEVNNSDGKLLNSYDVTKDATYKIDERDFILPPANFSSRFFYNPVNSPGNIVVDSDPDFAKKDSIFVRLYLKDDFVKTWDDALKNKDLPNYTHGVFVSLSIQDGKLVKKDATIFTNPTVRGYVSGIMEKDQDGNMTLSEAKKGYYYFDNIFFPANINGYANPTMSHGPILDFGKISTVADRENYIVSMDFPGFVFPTKDILLGHDELPSLPEGVYNTDLYKVKEMFSPKIEVFDRQGNLKYSTNIKHYVAPLEEFGPSLNLPTINPVLIINPNKGFVYQDRYLILLDNATIKFVDIETGKEVYKYEIDKKYPGEDYPYPFDTTGYFKSYKDPGFIFKPWGGGSSNLIGRGSTVYVYPFGFLGNDFYFAVYRPNFEGPDVQCKTDIIRWNIKWTYRFFLSIYKMSLSGFGIVNVKSDVEGKVIVSKDGASQEFDASKPLYLVPGTYSIAFSPDETYDGVEIPSPKTVEVFDGSFVELDFSLKDVKPPLIDIQDEVMDNSVNLTLKVSDNYSAIKSVKINGEETLVLGGIYTNQYEIKDGYVYIKVAVEDNQGNFTEKEYVYDKANPELKFNVFDSVDYSLGKADFNVRGSVLDNSGFVSVKINGKEVEVKSDGSFSKVVSTNVYYGTTFSINIEASDKAGNKVTKSYSYTFKNKTTIRLTIGDKNFFVDSMPMTLDSPPIIKNGRTLLPIRAVIESLGGSVSWDAKEKKVTVSLGSTTIELWIGKSIAKVNGIDTPIDSTNSKVVPEIINGRTMLPLRFVTENLGCEVQWDGTTKTITIIYIR